MTDGLHALPAASPEPAPAESARPVSSPLPAAGVGSVDPAERALADAEAELANLDDLPPAELPAVFGRIHASLSVALATTTSERTAPDRKPAGPDRKPAGPDRKPAGPDRRP